MLQRVACPRDRDPVGMRDAHLVAHGVRIRASDDAHAESAASDHELAEGIGLPEPRAAVVQRHLGRIVRDDSAGAERGGIGVEAAEVVEPELRVEPAGVVLDERQLHPAHRSVEPAGQRLERRAGALRWQADGLGVGWTAKRGECSSARRDLQEPAAGKRVPHAADCNADRRSAVGGRVRLQVPRRFRTPSAERRAPNYACAGAWAAGRRRPRFARPPSRPMASAAQVSAGVHSELRPSAVSSE